MFHPPLLCQKRCCKFFHSFCDQPFYFLFGDAQEIVRAQVEKLTSSDGVNIDALRRGVRNALSNQLWNRTHTRPMIIPVVMEV